MKRFSQLTQTASEADLVAGNFLAIDAPGVGGATKKLPAEDVAPKSVQNKTIRKQSEIEGELASFSSDSYATQSTITGYGIDATGKISSDIYHKIRYVAVNENDVLKYHIKAWSNRDVVCAFYSSTPTSGSVGVILYEFPAPVSSTEIDFYVVAPAAGYMAISISTNSESVNRLYFGTPYERLSNMEENIKSVDLFAKEKTSEIVGNLSSFGENEYSAQTNINSHGINQEGKIVSDTYHHIRYISVNSGDLLHYHIKAWSNRDVVCGFFSYEPANGSVCDEILFYFPAPSSGVEIDFYVVAPEAGYMAISISTNSESVNRLYFGTPYEKIDKIGTQLVPITENVYKNSIENPVNWICRLGWQVYYATTPPIQSIPSFKIAYDKGCRFMLADLRITSDGKFVCCHDDVVNSVIRNIDGTEVVGDVSVSASTLDDLNQYDWGLYKGSEWAGMKVPQIVDFLRFCRYKNIGCFIEIKVSMSQAQVDELAAMVKMFGIEKNFMVRHGDLATAEAISALLPESKVGIGWGNLTQQKIDDVKNSSIPKGKGFVGFSTMSTYTQALGQYAASNDVSLWFSEIENATDLSDFETLGALDGVGYVSSRLNLLTYLVSKYE